MKKILVTGARGFIASHLIDKLLEDPNNQIVGTSSVAPNYLNLDQSKKLYIVNDDHLNLINYYKPDLIYHADAISTNSQHDDIWLKNVDQTYWILDAISKTENYKPIFIFLSSIVTYHFPLNLYAASKCAGEILVESYHDMGYINGVIYNLCAVVGARNRKGLVRDIIIKLKSDNPNLELLGERPGSCKPYSYIHQVVASLADEAIYTDLDGTLLKCFVHPLNSITVEEVANIVMKELNIYKPIVWLGDDANFKGDQKNIVVSDHFSDYTSQDAICAGIRDILQNDYAGGDLV